MRSASHYRIIRDGNRISYKFRGVTVSIPGHIYLHDNFRVRRSACDAAFNVDLFILTHGVEVYELRLQDKENYHWIPRIRSSQKTRRTKTTASIWKSNIGQNYLNE